jgi:hypothetical protein
MAQQGATLQNYNNELVKCEYKRGSAVSLGSAQIACAALLALQQSHYTFPQLHSATSTNTFARYL